MISRRCRTRGRTTVSVLFRSPTYAIYARHRVKYIYAAKYGDRQLPSWQEERERDSP